MGNERGKSYERRARVGDLMAIVVNLDVVLAQRKVKLKDLKKGDKAIIESITYRNGVKACQSVVVLR